MGTTTRLLLEKLVAGASTRADLISYWNSNADILDALITSNGLSGGQTIVGGIGIAPPTANRIDSVLRVGTYLDIIQTYSDASCFIGGNCRLSASSATNKFIPVYNAGYGMLMKQDFGSTIQWYGINWNSSSVEKEFADFILAMSLTYNGNLWVAGDVNCASVTDHTPHFLGDALAAIRKIKAAKNGEIDHASLPDFAINPYQDKRGEWWPGRSLGDMVSVLTVAIQQLAANYDAAIAGRDLKIEKLSKRIDALAAKIEKN